MLSKGFELIMSQAVIAESIQLDKVRGEIKHLSLSSLFFLPNFHFFWFDYNITRLFFIFHYYFHLYANSIHIIKFLS